MSEAVDRPAVGLRERKKERTREMIRAHALHLFATQGYDETKVQQIIDEVEISESTFFRYFPTKADVVLTDDFDPLIVDSFQRQPRTLNSVQALRKAFRDAFGRLSRDEVDEQRSRMRIILGVPELRAAMLDQFASAMQLLAAVLAERSGRSPDDLAVRTLAGAVVGVAMAVMLAVFEDPTADLAELLDQAMGELENGPRL